MKKIVALIAIAFLAMMILSEPVWAITAWSNPGSNPTTIPPGKAIGLFRGLSEIQKIKAVYAIATTVSRPAIVLPGEVFQEMTEGDHGTKAFVNYGGVDTLRGQCWVIDNVEIIQFVACNNVAWRPICPLPPPCPKPNPVSPPPAQPWDSIGKIPWYALPVIAIFGGPIILGAYLFAKIFGSSPSPGSPAR